MTVCSRASAPLLHIPPFGLRDGRLRAGITTRLGFPGAVSNDPDSADRAQTRELLAGLLHVGTERLSWVRQVHGARLLEADRSGLLGDGDALATTNADRVLLVSVADCVPVLINHRKGPAHAGAHAGWRGVVKGVIHTTLDWFEDQNAFVDELDVWLGPHICADHFEVGPEVAERFDEAHVVASPGEQNPHVDLAAAVTSQLVDRGVSASRVHRSPYCTYCHHDLFWSYRRDGGICGRHVAFLGG